jgi:SAM-dependent methyltransferase
MARWGRAARLLSLQSGSKVLDLGCAFGHGTRILTSRYHVWGRDLSPDFVARARARLPSVDFTCGPAGDLPYPDSFFDGVVLLDVLEHVPNEAVVVSEIARVIRPGGELIVSTPHSGILGGLDSLNLYQLLFGRTKPAPTDDPSWALSPVHRHYTARDLRKLLGPAFLVESVQYTGVGIAELINLFLLVLVRRMLRSEALYSALQYVYFGAYILEDELSIGRFSYHVMIKCRRVAG